MKLKNIDMKIISSIPISDEYKSILNRRVNKLKRDPKGFIESSYNKRSAQIIDKMPIKYKGSNNFTVVSAVYNVENYLDDYFKSLINQSLSFKKRINLILIDDGSTDNSVEIIKKWQIMYPKSIKYIYKENGGQASARNLGIKEVKTEWVTFIDPDDFIDRHYFKTVDDYITKNNNIDMIVSNLKFFMEDENVIRDKHPLRFRFKNPIEKFENSDLKNFINLSAAATFFKKDLILRNNIEFNENIKPTFEDGKMIADYLMIDSSEVAFLKNAVYLYRKRSNKTSTVDKSWSTIQKYDDVLKHGYLSVLETYSDFLGYIPRHIQRTVLYDISWYLRLLIDNPEKSNFLTLNQKDNFYNLLLLIFKHIDLETILDFNLAGLWFAHKIGILGAFKKEKQESQIAYIENIDREKKQILISYFTYFDLTASFRLDNKDSIPKYEKIVKHTFIDRLFVKEKRYWISFEDENSVLALELDGKPVRITLQKKQNRNGVRIKDILNAYQPSSKYHPDGSWILMDRDTQADDNAEHLYRYLMVNHPEQCCYFSLRKESADWSRLKEEGFNLVEFGTTDFENHLRKASKIISSHLDKYVNNYFGDEYEYSKKFVFLQHGVIKDDLSSWFKTKKNLQCILTTTAPEYSSLVENNSYYKLTEKEVVLTGLPRHDSLLHNNCLYTKNILIMPTWRQNIMGKVLGTGSVRAINESFMETDYALHWYNFLHSKRLEQLVREYDYKIIFAPHANIEPYMAMFDVPKYIDIWQASTANTSMQQLFQQAKLMITDYSSVAFEMGLLEKTVLYYQFDQKDVFSGAHIYQPGYFSYEKDGFGPIVNEEKELFVELENILANDGAPLEPYATRIQNTFAYRDTNNCQRVYEAIIDLDRPDDHKINIDILYDMTVSAYDHQSWDLVESRSKLLVQHGDEEQKIWAENILSEALFYQNKFTELFEVLEIQDSTFEVQNYWKAKVAFATADWQEVIELLESKSALDDELMLMLLFSYAEVGQVAEFDKLKDEVQKLEITPVQFVMIQTWSLCLYDEWEQLIQLLEIEISNFSTQELRDYLPQILMAKAYRNSSRFAEAHQQLADFETHTTNNSICRIEIAKLAFARDNYGKCIDQYESTVNGDIHLLPETAIWQYVLSHWNMEHIEELIKILPEMIMLHPKNTDFKLLFIRALAEQSQWEAILEQASLLNKEQIADVIYPVTLAKYRLGHIDEAYQNCIKPVNQHSYKYWSLIAEIALLVEDFELAKNCYKGMIAIYPNNDNADNWTKLNSLRYYK